MTQEEWHQHSDRQYPDLLIFLLSYLLLLLRKLSAVAVFLFQVKVFRLVIFPS